MGFRHACRVCPSQCETACASSTNYVSQVMQAEMIANTMVPYSLHDYGKRYLKFASSTLNPNPPDDWICSQQVIRFMPRNQNTSSMPKSGCLNLIGNFPLQQQWRQEVIGVITHSFNNFKDRYYQGETPNLSPKP